MDVFVAKKTSCIQQIPYFCVKFNEDFEKEKAGLFSPYRKTTHWYF